MRRSVTGDGARWPWRVMKQKLALLETRRNGLRCGVDYVLRLGVTLGSSCIDCGSAVV
jgi:hypothetical protein